MSEWLSSPLFGITLSILAYVFGVWINKKLRSPLANPLLIAIILVILFLKLTRIPLSSYQVGGDFIGMFLAPATACLAVSIYNQFALLKKKPPAHFGRFRCWVCSLYGQRLVPLPDFPVG